MVELVGFEYCDIITIKAKQDKTKIKTPFVLRVPTSNTSNNKSSQNCANVITHSCEKLVLKGLAPSTPELEQHKDKPLTSPSGKGTKLAKNSMPASYNILD